jgi:hypothetical protein
MRLIAVLLAVLICACAEEPSTPSDVSLIGSWSSPAVDIYSLSNIRMDLNQQDTGIVRGKWTATGTGGTAACSAGTPVGTPCNAFGSVVGRSTVSHVEIELLGAAKFEGRLVDNSTLRGVFELGDEIQPMIFNRTSLTPAATVVTR